MRQSAITFRAIAACLPARRLELEEALPRRVRHEAFNPSPARWRRVPFMFLTASGPTCCRRRSAAFRCWPCPTTRIVRSLVRRPWLYRQARD